MSTTIREDPNPGRKWWLAVLLAAVILAIVLGAFFATHPHVFGGSATATPTATSTPRAVVVTNTPTPAAPTSTPKPGPTGTPVPGPTGTPRPGATASPTPASTPAASVTTGQITHSVTQIDTIQRAANRKDPSYTFYLNPFQVVQHNLPAYGFKRGYTIIKPTPQPSPTPQSNSQGLPQVVITVQYQGKIYAVYLDQPVQKGPGGIWVIITIQVVS